MNRISKTNGPHNIDIYSLIFGSLLGDSYAEKRNGSTRFILQQEESNVSYLMWFHQYLATRGYCSPNKPKLETRIGPNGKVRFFYRVRTYSFASFNWIYDALYQNTNSKNAYAPSDPKARLAHDDREPVGARGPTEASWPEARLAGDLCWTLLTPLALAVWIMDDGTPVSAGLKIATNYENIEDVLFLCDVLNKKYNLYARPHRAGKDRQFAVYIPKAGMPQLGHWISAHMVPSMHRKLNGYFFLF